MSQPAFDKLGDAPQTPKGSSGLQPAASPLPSTPLPSTPATGLAPSVVRSRPQETSQLELPSPTTAQIVACAVVGSMLVMLVGMGASWLQRSANTRACAAMELAMSEQDKAWLASQVEGMVANRTDEIQGLFDTRVSKLQKSHAEVIAGLERELDEAIATTLEQNRTIANLTKQLEEQAKNTISPTELRRILDEERRNASASILALIDAAKTEMAATYATSDALSTRIDSLVGEIQDLGLGDVLKQPKVAEHLRRVVETVLREQSQSRTPEPTPSPTPPPPPVAQCPTPDASEGPSVDDVHRIVQQYLYLDASDHPLWVQDGRPLEKQDLTWSGSVVGALTSPSFPTTGNCNQTSWVDWARDVLVPRTSPPYGPEMALRRTLEPGDCWGVCGSKANLTVRFLAPSLPTHVVLEHVSKAMAGEVLSAPRNVSVVGFSDADLTTPTHVGDFVYDTEGSSHVQVFSVQAPLPLLYGVQLQILSNHRHPQFTCLYRFRVHGDEVAAA